MRGDVYLADLNPTRGAEQAGVRFFRVRENEAVLCPVFPYSLQARGAPKLAAGMASTQRLWSHSALTLEVSLLFCFVFPVQHAVQLFNEGRAPVVVFSGGTLKDAGIACSSAQLSLEAAQELGLPPGAAITASGAQSTYDEAMNISRLAQQHRWHSLIIVTDLFHTRRVARTFRTLLPDTTIYLSAAPDPNYDAGRWWQTEEGLVGVFNEVLKLAFYWARYGIAPVG